MTDHLDRAWTAIRGLQSIAPPPPDVARLPVSWFTVEDSVQTPLPSDYKELVGLYSSCVFNDFFYLYEPSANREINLQSARILSCGIIDDLNRIEQMPFAGNEVFPWASTVNGDSCYWVTKGDDPDRWTVTVTDSSGGWWKHDGNASSLLYGLLSQDIDCPFFPSEEFFPLPPKVERFEPAD